MNILYCNFHDGDGGGQTTYIQSLIESFHSQHNIIVAAPRTSRLYQQAEQLGVVVESIDFKIRFHRVISRFRQACRLYALIHDRSVDVIHLNGSPDLRLYSMVRFFLKRRPHVIYTKHNSLSLKWITVRRLKRCVNHIIAVCQFTQSQLVQAGFPLERTHVIYNAVDTLKLTPATPEKQFTLRKHYRIDDDQIVLGSVAGTAHYKNWPYILEALSHVKSDRFIVVLAGLAISDNDYHEYVVKRGLQHKVVFPGLFQDVREIIPLFDVGFVLSNAVETISFAAREMMSMGKPVLVSQYAGLPENITHGTDGWVVELNNPKALACILDSIASLSADALRLMQHNAREKALKDFSCEGFIQQTYLTYLTTTKLRAQQ